MVAKQQTQKLLHGNGTLEDLQAGRQMFEALADVFSRSIIGHTGWADSITEEQKQRIQIERLKQIKETKGKIDMATDYEAMIYLSTASLTAPLSRMWQQIYFYLFKKFYPDKSDFIPDYEAKLDIQSEPALKDLKRWIYKQSKKEKKP